MKWGKISFGNILRLSKCFALDIEICRILYWSIRKRIVRWLISLLCLGTGVGCATRAFLSPQRFLSSPSLSQQRQWIYCFRLLYLTVLSSPLHTHIRHIGGSNTFIIPPYPRRHHHTSRHHFPRRPFFSLNSLNSLLLRFMWHRKGI